MRRRAYRVRARDLPPVLAVPLFGDRARYGQVACAGDPDWEEWQAVLHRFYRSTQRNALGGRVTASGYRVAGNIPLAGRRVLELGAGDIRHDAYWSARPAAYTVCDVDRGMLHASLARLKTLGISAQGVLLPSRRAPLPFADAAFDVIFCFYMLEHLHPLDNHLVEMSRVLVPGGVLAGAIPCEGGLAWGTGRFLTTRRWLHRHTTVDPDKIICWEHPNFGDAVLNALDRYFDRRDVRFWPFAIPSLDVNLVASFTYARRR